MGNSTNWFFRIVRIAGAGFPIAGNLIQFQAEIDSHQADNRLQKLEEDIQRMKNPISFLNELHEDMENLSKEIYIELSSKDDDYFRFPDDKFYSKFEKPLELLHAKRLIELQRAQKTSKSPGIEKTSPEYIIYMCTFCEDQDKMARLTEIIDNLKKQETLHSGKIKRELQLPEVVIKAMFKIYEKSGRGKVYGDHSNQYCCR